MVSLVLLVLFGFSVQLRHVDDDTVVPADMVFDESVWEHPETDAVSYGITMQQSCLTRDCDDKGFLV